MSITDTKGLFNINYIVHFPVTALDYFCQSSLQNQNKSVTNNNNNLKELLPVFTKG